MPEIYSLGLIGFPLEHSLSPLLHRAALHACGLEGSYELFPIAPLPDSKEDLEQLLSQLRQGKLQGVNVTIPHKQAVLPFLDELTPTARAIGAVNTILCSHGKLSGENTDAAGFSADLKNLLLGDNHHAVLLGAGGAARAVVYALLKDGWQIHIAARREEQAAELAQSFNYPASQISFSGLTEANLSKAAAKCSLIVNTTPVGMYPNITETPWPEQLSFPEGAGIYDLVYNPVETQLVRTARAAGLPARNGLGMLVEQAACAFELWTGRSVSRATIQQYIPSSFFTDLRSES